MSLLNRSARALAQIPTIEEIKNEVPFPANLEVEKEIVIAKLGSYVDIIKHKIIYGPDCDVKDEWKLTGYKIRDLSSKIFNNLDLSSRDTEKDVRKLYESLKRKYNSLSIYQKNILYFYIKIIRSSGKFYNEQKEIYEYIPIEYTLDGKFVKPCIEDLMMPEDNKVIYLNVHEFFPYGIFLDIEQLPDQEHFFDDINSDIIYSIYNFIYDLFMNNYQPIKLYNPTEKELRDAEIARKEFESTFDHEPRILYRFSSGVTISTF